MQNKLIEVNMNIIGGEEVNSVNARDIHNYLGVKTKFADWIQRAIKKYDFIENEDYLVLKNEKQVNNQIRVSKEYIVTMDMAKELSMLENNKKGKETRKYFIRMEKEALKQIGSQSKETDLLGVVLELVKNQQQQTDVMIELMREMKTERENKTVQIGQPIYIDGRSRRNIHEEVKQRTRELADELGVDKETIAPAIWIALKKFFDVDDYQDILQSQLKEALSFIAHFEVKKSIFNKMEMVEL